MAPHYQFVELNDLDLEWKSTFHNLLVQIYLPETLYKSSENNCSTIHQFISSNA